MSHSYSDHMISLGLRARLSKPFLTTVLYCGCHFSFIGHQGLVLDFFRLWYDIGSLIFVILTTSSAQLGGLRFFDIIGICYHQLSRVSSPPRLKLFLKQPSKPWSTAAASLSLHSGSFLSAFLYLSEVHLCLPESVHGTANPSLGLSQYCFCSV